MGMTIPTAYGGAGPSFHDAVLVVEEMARACSADRRGSSSRPIWARISAIMAYGSEAQKRSARRLVLVW